MRLKIESRWKGVLSKRLKDKTLFAGSQEEYQYDQPG